MYHEHEVISLSETDRGVQVVRGVDADLVVGAVVVLALTFWALSPWPLGGAPASGTGLGPLLVVAGAAGTLVRARWGRGRGRRTVVFDATGVVLLAAAVLLSPEWLPLVALASSLQAHSRRAAINTCVRTIAACAAAVVYRVGVHALSGLRVAAETARVAELLAACATLLLVEVLLHRRHLRRADRYADEVSGLVAAAAGRDTPALALGALLCVLLAVSPASVLLLVPLVLLLARSLRDQERLLDAGLDAKSGLLRLDAFVPLAEAEVSRARRRDRPLALLMLDLDGMKSVNTEHGHLVGERVLESVGALLRRTMRLEDVVARFGGDEFCLLLPDTDADGALVLAERLRVEIAATVLAAGDPPVRRSASVGVAALRDADSVATLVARADAGLRRAKAEGRNRVVVEPAPAGSPGRAAAAGPGD